MSCYSPLIGYRAKDPNPNGKRNIVFNPKEAIDDGEIKLPCGQCIGCILERSRQWAVRCVHEASLYEDNSFITLTFDNENLPKSGSIDPRDFQLFMKRLRKSETGKKIRFFHCGEYGEKYLRPHYHALLFNHDFKDKTHWKTHNGEKYYISEELQKLWPFGFSTIGDVTFESAAYVARYITKKINGDQALEHYCDINKQIGEIIKERKPEYITMSRRPGIGNTWFQKYKEDVFPDDFVIMRGKKIKPPKYYDFCHELECPENMEEIKERRQIKAYQFSGDQTGERLNVKRIIKETKFKQLKRGLDNET